MSRPLWRHPIDATGNSMAGLRVLLRQRPTQLHILMGVVTSLVFALVGVPAVNWAVMLGLWLLGLVTEAINTAIELIVDRTSPEWSEYARDAKDLGSLSVTGVLLAFMVHAFWAAGAALT